MKARFIVSILFIVCVNTRMIANVSIDDILHRAHNKQIVNSVAVPNTCQSNFSNDYGSLSQIRFSNQSRDLTLYSIIVAVIGVLVGIITNMSIAARNNQRDDIEKFKGEIRNLISNQDTQIREGIDDFNRIRNEIETRTNDIKRIQSQQNYQIQFLQRNNQYLFSVTNSIVDSSGGDSESTLDIRNSLYNQYYIVKTFLPWSDGPADSTQAAFMYLQYNGTLDNIDDLQFIADNDPDERKRNMAIGTIHFIRARYDCGQAS